MSKVNNKIRSTSDINNISSPIDCNYWKGFGLDWGESSWTRWISVVFWSWLNPLLNLGSKRQLTEDDLFDLSHNDECNHLLNKFEKVLKINENKTEYINIWKIIFKTFWKENLIYGLILFVYNATKIAQPLFLKQIVINIKNLNFPSYQGYFYAIGLGLSICFQSLIHHQLFFRTTRIGTHIRIGLSSVIYIKLLSLPRRVIMKTTTTGQLLNLISNDISKFEESSMFFNQIWSAPLEAMIVFGLIWNEIGIPTLFGYGVLFILIPLQSILSKQLGVYRENTVKWTDKRLKIINEILVGCQIIKMYRWEESIEDLVYNSRENEVKSIRRVSRIRSINLAISFSSLSLISLATFGGSWLMGQTLSSSNIFTVLSLFNIIRGPLTGQLPHEIEKLSESIVASKRINQFMNLSRQTPRKTLEEYSISDDDHSLGSIIMNKASFTWDSSQSIKLIDINLNINNGLLVGIIGTIGSCKSSLLSAILGEMSLVKGFSNIYGQIAYVPQTPWIFSGTIRENILFFKSFDKDKYERVLKSCQLIPDLRSFSCGDLTLISEKGINLSEGQKSRITLARALYTSADIYLFDDPLASLDSTVAKKVFKECLSNQGILKNKTRLLVTHQIEFLTEFDHCILLNHGQIEKQGTFNQLFKINKIKELFQNHTNQIRETNKQLYNSDPMNSNEMNIIKEERSFDGTVNINVWLKLLTSVYGWFGLLLLIFLILLGEGIYDTTNKWLTIWSSKSSIEQNKNQYIYIYLALVISTCIISFIRVDYFFYLILRGASVLHNNMFKGVLYSSLRFYESNPVGRILNRFSKDQQIVDELLPVAFFDTIHLFTMIFGSIIMIGMINPWILFILIPIIPIFISLRRIYLKTSLVLKRLESVTRTPIYTLVSSSINGLTTIRAFNMENHFRNLFIDKINRNSRVVFLVMYSSRWFGLRLDLLTSYFVFLTSILSVALRNNIDGSSIALGLSYSINLTSLFQWASRQSADMEILMTSAQRIDEYSHIPSESDFYIGESKPPINWPNKGKIQFKNYKLKYREELKPVLKGLNLTIHPTNKIGIIGRTGAGKSSIFQAIFRLIDKSLTNGQILIDGIDINKISLNHLRSILNIIPQSPVLFSNTLRYNLDPFTHYTDKQIWDALQTVQLKRKISKLKDKLNIQITEYGTNFSVGECQLICVARAILKKSHILLIDEATAHLDTKTDQIIQQVLRHKFNNQTIITITHRLNTIMDSDQIIIINDGIIIEYGTPKQIIIKQNQFIDHFNN